MIPYQWFQATDRQDMPMAEFAYALFKAAGAVLLVMRPGLFSCPGSYRDVLNFNSLLVLP